MAGRKQKRSVDYFPHFVESGKTLFTLEKMFGNNGYSTPFKVLEILASTEDHFCDFSAEEDWLYICAKLNLDEDLSLKILGMMAKLDFIDKHLYENKVLWCGNLVENLRPVYEKRKSELPSRPITGAGIPKTGAEIRQSKVKGSKVEKKKTYGQFENVKLTDDELAKLKVKFNSHFTEKIEELSIGIESKGYKYKSHYATILSWARQKEKETPAQPKRINNADETRQMLTDLKGHSE